MNLQSKFGYCMTIQTLNKPQVDFSGQVDFICFGQFKLWAMRRKPELQNEKFLPTAGLKSTISHLLDVGWLFVLRINVALAIFKPYHDLEAGNNQFLKS